MPSDETSKVIRELFESWYSSLLRYACRATGSLEMAEDLVQEVFLLLCHELRSGAKINSPKGWTLRVVRHQISKHLSFAKDRGYSFEPLDGSAPAALHSAFWTEPDVYRDLEIDDVTRLFSILSNREEEVVLLRMESMKYREIADHLGISAKSVSTLLGRALRKLKDEAKRRDYRGTTIESDAR